jgi:hypothetical protein
MRRSTILVIAIAFMLGGALGMLGLLAGDVLKPSSTAAPPPNPVWTEVPWPFLMDQWGKGKAFQCKAEDCGTEVKLYLRAKLGSCNCTTGVADDTDLDRMSDLDLVSGEVLPLGAGRPITIAWMKGRSRAYTLNARNWLGRSAIAVVLNDRCDMIVATVVLPHDRPATIEPGVMEFLNSRTVLHWAEIALGI